MATRKILRLFSAVRKVLLVSALAITPTPCPASDHPPPLAAQLERSVPERMARDRVSGAVIVLLEKASPVWTGTFGVSDRESATPITADALFRVESLSKPVTAWGAMRLAALGKLDLDAPIRDCLVHWQPPSGAGALTARQLLSHSAGVGLGNFAARYPPDTARPELGDHLHQDFSLITLPGQHFSYSDTGFNLLELVMQACTREDFSAFMTREVLEPLGMTTASFDWTGAPMPVGYDLNDNPVAPYVYPGRASGGLHATAADMARFVIASMKQGDPAVLSAEQITELHSPLVPVEGMFSLVAEGYGLGHFTETLSDGRAAVWHGGQGHGWMSHMHIVPETGDGIIILSNSQRAWPLFAAILQEWSKSLGVEPVGMARVLWIETAAYIAVALCLVITFVAFTAIRRAWRCPVIVRTAAGVTGTVLMLWPLWAAMQDYLFLFSVLPGLWMWLGMASAFAGAGLATLAIVARRTS